MPIKLNSIKDYNTMEKSKFVQHIEESKEQIEQVLEIDTMKKELEALKKEMEMLSLLKKFFQNNENKDNSKLEELKTQNKQLKDELENSNKTILTLQEEKIAQEFENKKLHSNNLTLTQEKSTLQKELLQAKETPLNKLQALYDSLSSTTQSGIKNSLHSDDPLTLFASGVLHIEPIWEYAKYLLLEEKIEDFEILRKIFYILFETYKNVEELEYQKVSVGEEFDSHEHIKDSKSESAGTIQTIQLKGFCRDGEVVKKTIVRVN
jgi:hypothetical protein